MTRSSSAGLGGCLVVGFWRILTLVIYLILVGLSFQYCLWATFGKDAPWHLDALGGFVLGWATIAAAIVLWILNVSGVHMPIWG